VNCFRSAIGVAVLAIGSLRAQSPSDSTERARVAVQQFYEWYLPREAKPDGRDMVMVAATKGPLVFDKEMVRWLRIDSLARARAKDDIDGLDGDPYLNAQDPCDRYRAESVQRQGARFLINVRGVGGCQAHSTPDVIVVLEASANRWTVRDFLDPREHNKELIALLRELHPRAK
jgi:hypothetical protein